MDEPLTHGWPSPGNGVHPVMTEAGEGGGDPEGGHVVALQVQYL